jgi:hypothetical protein
MTPTTTPPSTTTTTSPVEVLATMAVENLQRLGEERPANMSRRRFVFMQINSLVIAILTFVSFISFWILSRVETINNLVAGPCGIGMLLLRNLTGVPPNKSCTSTDNL